VFSPYSAFEVIEVDDVREQAAGPKNMLADVVPPVDGHKRTAVANWIAVVLRGQKMMNSAIDYFRSQASRFFFVDDWYCENVHSTRLECAGDFPEGLFGIKDVLEDILSDMEIDGAIAERKLF